MEQSKKAETKANSREGYPLTRYCPFSVGALYKMMPCVSNCEWHDGDGCVIWGFLKILIQRSQLSQKILEASLEELKK